MKTRNPIITTLAALSLTLAGCTSVHSLEAREKFRGLKPGEQATIYGRDGSVSRITVTAVTAREIKGFRIKGGAIVAYEMDDIENIEVERIDPLKSVFAGAGLVAGIAAAVLIGMVMTLLAASGG